MARQTRQQRRERRRQQDGNSAALERPAARQPVRAPAEAAPRQPAARRGGVAGFVGESWAELNKVEWPGRDQLIQGTVVVLIACVIVGLFLWGCDLAFKHFVQQVLLK